MLGCMHSGGGGRRGGNRGAEGAEVRPGTPRTVSAAYLLQCLLGRPEHAHMRAYEFWTASFVTLLTATDLHCMRRIGDCSVSQFMHPGAGRRLSGRQGTRRLRGTEGRGQRVPRRRRQRSQRRQSPRQAVPRCPLQRAYPRLCTPPSTIPDCNWRIRCGSTAAQQVPWVCDCT